MYEISDYLLSLLVKSYHQSGFIILTEKNQDSQGDEKQGNITAASIIKSMIVPMNILYLPIRCGWKDSMKGHMSCSIIVLFPFNRKREPIAWSELIKRLNAGIQAECFEIQCSEPESSREMTIHAFYSCLERFCENKPSRLRLLSANPNSMNQLFFAEQPQTIMGAHARFAAGELCMPIIAWREYIKRSFELGNQRV